MQKPDYNVVSLQDDDDDMLENNLASSNMSMSTNGDDLFKSAASFAPVKIQPPSLPASHPNKIGFIGEHDDDDENVDIAVEVPQDDDDDVNSIDTDDIYLQDNNHLRFTSWTHRIRNTITACLPPIDKCCIIS